MICTNKEGESKEIDARTSDAIAMAVRFNCPIYSWIHSSAGMVLDETEGATEEEKPKSLLKKSAAKKVTEVATITPLYLLKS